MACSSTPTKGMSCRYCKPDGTIVNATVDSVISGQTVALTFSGGSANNVGYSGAPALNKWGCSNVNQLWGTPHL